MRVIFAFILGLSASASAYRAHMAQNRHNGQMAHRTPLTQRKVKITHKQSLAAAFSEWGEKKTAEELMKAHVNRAAHPYFDLDVAFWQWQKDTEEREKIQRQVNMMAQSDIKVQLSFEGKVKTTTLRGTGKTDALMKEMSRLFQVDRRRDPKFMYNGAAIPLGVPICESVFADLEEGQTAEINVLAKSWWA